MTKKNKLSDLITTLESGSREKGGSSASGIISIGGTQLSNTGGFKWDKKEYVSERFYMKMKQGKIEKNDILIVKDGATTGKVSFVDDSFPYEKAVINEHVFRMQIDSFKANPKFIFYYLYSDRGKKQILRDFRGAAVGGITKTFIDFVDVLLPDIEVQNKIVTILERIRLVTDKREETVSQTEEITKSIFLNFFGNPITNETGWNKLPLSEFGTIITGNTPPRKNKNNYSSRFIEWIKTDNISKSEIGLTEAEEYLSEEGFKISRWVNKNALLVACIAGSISSIGRSSITDRRVAFNQQINALVPNSKTSIYFLYWMFQISEKYIQSFASTGMKKLISKGVFEKIEFINPDLALQKKFERLAIRLDNYKKKLITSQNHFSLLMQSVADLAFTGKLTLTTAATLEVLLENNYTYFQKNSDEKSIQLLIEKLNKDSLNEAPFRDLEIYNNAKNIAFELLKEGKLNQVYDLKSKKIKLTL